MFGCSVDHSGKPTEIQAALALSGKQYADNIARYIVRNYGERGLCVYREVVFGKSIIGKNRRIDVFVYREGSPDAMAIECKYQNVAGTADEKLPYALADLEAMHVPVCLTYAGEGFSPGVLQMLAASPIAAYCLPNAELSPCDATRELDQMLAMTFKWWDVMVRGRGRVKV